MGSYSFADLFSGCGGISLGLLQAGLEGRFAIERDPMAFATFSANFLDRPCPAGSFQWPDWLEKQAWDIEELLDSHREQLRSLRGNVDVLAGGPPCQGFSFAGRRVEDDPRNQLFQRYVEVVDAIRPKAIILENVPGMRVAHSKGNVVELKASTSAPRRQSYYDKLVQSLRSCGYEVHSDLVDASRFGVPQRRSRLIAIGLRRDLLRFVPEGIARGFELLEEARTAQLRILGLGEEVTAQAALSDLEANGRHFVECVDPESQAGFREVSYAGPETHYQELMQAGLRGGMDSMRMARHRPDVAERFGRILAECRKGVRMDDESRRAYGIRKHRIYPMSATSPAPTITTLPDDVLHYSEPRILTVRESARLQSFPDWFRFKGKFTTGGDRRTKECPRYTQVGNAVPPYLARAIGTAVSQLLDEAALNRSIWGAQPQQSRKAATA